MPNIVKHDISTKQNKASNGAPTKFLKSKKEIVRMNRKPAFFTKNNSQY